MNNIETQITNQEQPKASVETQKKLMPEIVKHPESVALLGLKAIDASNLELVTAVAQINKLIQEGKWEQVKTEINTAYSLAQRTTYTSDKTYEFLNELKEQLPPKYQT